MVNKCLNCEKEITEDAEVCSEECSEEYFRYVFGEELKDHPEFKTKIEEKKMGKKYPGLPKKLRDKLKLKWELKKKFLKKKWK